MAAMLDRGQVTDGEAFACQDFMIHLCPLCPLNCYGIIQNLITCATL